MKMNRIIRILMVLGMVFLTLLLVTLAIKPGASIFYSKERLRTDRAEFTETQIVYPVTISSTYFDLDTLLVRENGVLLEHIKVEELPGRIEPAFAVETLGNDEFKIRIIPGSEDLENVNLADIEILVRPIFITQQWIKILALILGIGCAFSFASILADPASRKKISSNIFGFLQIWDKPAPILSVMIQKFSLLLRVLPQTVFVAFFFTSMEWLFFVTKPSFMDLLSFGTKLGILFSSGFFLWVAIVIFILFIFILDLFFSRIIAEFQDFIYFIPSALVLAGSALLLFDNFTYTVFSFGVSTTTSRLRLLYGVGFIVAFVLSLRYLSGRMKAKTVKRANLIRISGVGALLAMAVLFLIVQYDPVTLQSDANSISGDSQTPNIILISDDGINAANMSLYGYERETTPFQDSIASSSLLMMNNFTNANTSTGSDTAMLTGKLPFETGVMYSPNTLEGMDSLEHLPGILKKAGYRTMSIGVPQFVDMGMVNFQNGFDSINGETNIVSDFVSLASSFGYNDAAYFFQIFVNRVSDRLLHITYVRSMKNAYQLVTEATPTSVGVNMSEAYDILTNNLDQASQSDQPLFAHIHLISTHGSMFYPREQVFSEGEEQSEGWMTDFYDDAILDYDHWLEDLVTYLKNAGLYDDTIIAFYTDHGERWSIDNRIPLMIHFPNDEYSGEVVANTQNLDIAPTILEYLGMDVPDWMSGDLLLGELDRTRLIYSAKINSDAFGRDGAYEDVIKPPFYQFETIAVIQCQYIYEINLDAGTMVRKTIADYVDPCDEAVLATSDEIWDSAMGLLTDYGFQIPSSWDDPMSYKIE